MDTDCAGWGPCFGVYSLRWLNMVNVNSHICSRYSLMIGPKPEAGLRACAHNI